MRLRLVKLSEEYKEQLYDMMDEWYADGGKLSLMPSEGVITVTGRRT